MSYNIVTIAPFDKQLKRLVKKYPSLKNEVAQLGKLLTETPSSGTPLGNNCYKVRLSIVYLLAIYDKSEQGNISDKQILNLLDSIAKK